MECCWPLSVRHKSQHYGDASGHLDESSELLVVSLFEDMTEVDSWVRPGSSAVKQQLKQQSRVSVGDGIVNCGMVAVVEGVQIGADNHEETTALDIVELGRVNKWGSPILVHLEEKAGLVVQHRFECLHILLFDRSKEQVAAFQLIRAWLTAHPFV